MATERPAPIKRIGGGVLFISTFWHTKKNSEMAFNYKRLNLFIILIFFF
jgi:hypothetical protein